eukprot:1157698-Pyramimonas_sp.AAC.1
MALSDAKRAVVQAPGCHRPEALAACARSLRSCDGGVPRTWRSHIATATTPGLNNFRARGFA